MLFNSSTTALNTYFKGLFHLCVTGLHFLKVHNIGHVQ